MNEHTSAEELSKDLICIKFDVGIGLQQDCNDLSVALVGRPEQRRPPILDVHQEHKQMQKYEKKKKKFGSRN